MNREKSNHYYIDVVAETPHDDPFKDLAMDVCTKAIEDVREYLRVLSKNPITEYQTYSSVYRWWVGIAESSDKKKYTKEIDLYKKLSAIEKELIDTLDWILCGDYSAWGDRPNPMQDIERVIAQYPNVDTMGIYSKYTKIKKGA